MLFPRVVSCALLASAVSLAAIGSAPRPADACGAFFAAKSVPAESRPSLSLERVLLVFDPAKKQEHFIREVVFRGGREKFGFVVPTPTRPGVFEVKKAPFDELERRFPFAIEPSKDEGSKSRAAGGAPGGGAPKVVVLEVKYLGSFAAFVIQATDHEALGKWLADNGFSSTIEGDRWLAEYVKRGFYFVAFRYEPTLDEKSGDGGLRAQTVRISFQTPAAFYPYREPAHAAPAERKLRAVELWVASPSPLVPVARASDRGAAAWVRPFREGRRSGGEERGGMGGTLGDELAKLLPSGPLVVQTFQDQKTLRSGYSDVVFLPEGGVGGDVRDDVGTFVKSTIASPKEAE
jgi:hypothetical protein